jgi:hypothetical protein
MNQHPSATRSGTDALEPTRSGSQPTPRQIFLMQIAVFAATLSIAVLGLVAAYLYLASR